MSNPTSRTNTILNRCPVFPADQTIGIPTYITGSCMLQYEHYYRWNTGTLLSEQVDVAMSIPTCIASPATTGELDVLILGLISCLGARPSQTPSKALPSMYLKGFPSRKPPKCIKCPSKYGLWTLICDFTLDCFNGTSSHVHFGKLYGRL